LSSEEEEEEVGKKDDVRSSGMAQIAASMASQSPEKKKKAAQIKRLAYGPIPHYRNRADCMPNQTSDEVKWQDFFMAENSVIKGGPQNTAHKPLLALLQYMEKVWGRNEMNLYAVNAGANDGVRGDPTQHLYTHMNYTGVAIEPQLQTFRQLEINYQGYERVKCLHSGVTPGNVEGLLRKHGAPLNMDIFKIDIDHDDILIVQALLLSEYRPKAVVMEFNEKIPPPIFFSMNYARQWPWAGDHCYGVSLAYAAHVLGEFGYRPVIVDGNNMVFVDANAKCQAFRNLTSDTVTLYEQGYSKTGTRRKNFPWNENVDPWLSIVDNESMTLSLVHE
jgi:hypothetical protein